jgi:hypothetical protein
MDIRMFFGYKNAKISILTNSIHNMGNCNPYNIPGLYTDTTLYDKQNRQNAHSTVSVRIVHLP